MKNLAHKRHFLLLVALASSGLFAPIQSPAQDKPAAKEPPKAAPTPPKAAPAPPTAPVPAPPKVPSAPAAPNVASPVQPGTKEAPNLVRPPRAPVRLRPPAQQASGPLTKQRIPPSALNPPAASPGRGPDPDAENDEDAPRQFKTGVDFEPVSPRTRVTFNLEDADLPELVRLISNMTGRRFILPGKIRSIKATVFAPTDVSAAEAYRAFLSILEVNGLTVVPSGKYLKIMETGGIENQPLQIYGEGATIPRADRFLTRLLYLENVAADDVVSLLTRFKSKDGNITAYAPTNMLILTDTGTQIRRMMQIIEAIDVARTGTQTWIEPIHHANATELATRLQEIFPTEDNGPQAPSPARPRPRTPPRASNPTTPSSEPGTIGEATGGGSAIRNIIADERTNSLIIIASQRAYMRVLEMIRQLDVPLEGEGRIHVHYVQHSAAEDIAAALSSLIGGGGGAPRPPRGQAGPAAAAQGTLFEGEIRIASYESANALVITSSLHDYASLKRVIERLDRPRRQVFIEAVVMELSLTRSNDLGFAFHGGIPNLPVADSISVLGFNAGNSLTPVNQDSLTGLALGIRGPDIPDSEQLIGTGTPIPAFGVVINAMAQSGDVNILSTPHLIAMDNVEAEISVGGNIPLQTSGIPPGALAGLGGLGALGSTTGASGAAGLAGLSGLGSVQRQDIGTSIRVTPHINESDQVRLEIEEEISDRGEAEGTLGVIPINRRLARTEVMVRDQQTVVIGGLMREENSASESKVPVLGDIPILGVFFRDSGRRRQKTNLLLFLTPYIIRDASDLREIYERKMRERQEFIDRHFVFGDDDYEPTIDYTRTRGLVSEIVMEIDSVEHDRALALAAAAEPARQHVPRPPIGSYQESSGPRHDDVVISPDGTTDGEGEAPAESDETDEETSPQDLPDREDGA